MTDSVTRRGMILLGFFALTALTGCFFEGEGHEEHEEEEHEHHRRYDRYMLYNKGQKPVMPQAPASEVLGDQAGMTPS
jgi:hypothetical protein